MESLEDIAIHIKATFEDIEVYDLSRIENDIFSDDEKLQHLEEAKDKLVLLIQDIDNFKENI